MHELTQEDIHILDFEKRWEGVRQAGPKEAAIREWFDWSPTTYYAKLNRLLDNTAAWAYQPQMIKRLRNLREARRVQRSMGRVG